MMRTLKLTLAYDGTNYVGWQRQPDGVSVQQLVEDACAPLAGAGVAVAGAGRTDAGVHAIGQVASVHLESDLETDAIQRALNVRLPPDIRVTAVVDASARFHARFDATGKRYRYRLWTAPILSPFDRWFVWHAPWPLDLEAMRDAGARLEGQHDFASFQGQAGVAAGDDTVRTIRSFAISSCDNSEVVFEIEGDGFLRHMVRTIVGTLVEVGRGQRAAASIGAVLEARNRQAAGRTAPASGLTLVSVSYDGSPVPRAAASGALD
jgi:tRNA pseudouridine38-40 synthase